ncbi:MerR family transcriptional regulator [Amycolatopsis antarctica]|uniref:MerR family transcriptional regulator n=1 Tax=Amycolatopsis antarctica TaxID=1854586 RepID=A0A263D0T8_9PSEU|nr:MerR family transcriptional regulator [Amycolatopsis antarctica]OZM71738.1 MerR family transcriptional regulator [Amycolatopsis antarctica]
MRIGELARRSGVSVRSLRYYEEKGLLASTRSDSGQRHYVDTDVDRIRFIQCLYRAGLSSRTVAELLPCVDTPSPRNADEAWARLVAERERLDSYIGDLRETLRALDSVIAANRRHRESIAEADPAHGAVH